MTSTFIASAVISEVNEQERREQMCAQMARLIINRAVFLEHNTKTQTLDIYFYKGKKMHKVNFKGAAATLNRLVELFNEHTTKTV